MLCRHRTQRHAGVDRRVPRIGRTKCLQPAFSTPTTSSAPTAPLNTESLHTRLVNYKKQVPLDGGTLTIRPLALELMQPCTEILTDAFVDTAAAKLALYRRFLQRQISTYLTQQRAQLPRTIILTATWAPTTPEGGAADSAALSTSTGPSNGEGGKPAQPSSSSSRSGSSSGSVPMLLGTTEISFDPRTRSSYLTLNPPATAAYLANMAVAEQHRRKGVGMLLIQAVEELCEMVGQPDIYLHLRFQDAPAGKLYRRTGFMPAKEDAWFVLLLGLDRRYLMHKRLSFNSKDQ